MITLVVEDTSAEITVETSRHVPRIFLALMLIYDLSMVLDFFNFIDVFTYKHWFDWIIPIFLTLLCLDASFSKPNTLTLNEKGIIRGNAKPIEWHKIKGFRLGSEEGVKGVIYDTHFKKENSKSTSRWRTFVGEAFSLLWYLIIHFTTSLEFKNHDLDYIANNYGLTDEELMALLKKYWLLYRRYNPEGVWSESNIYQ